MALFKSKAKSFHKEEMQGESPKSLAVSYQMKRKMMAHGGMAKEDCEHGGPEMCAMGCYADGGEVETGPTPVMGSGVKDEDQSEDMKPFVVSGDGSTKDIPDSYRRAHNAGNFARGGMVDRVMARKMSKGGMVANEDLPEADFEPNEFDDLHLRDDLEGGYTGANSGDERSTDGEDERRRDMVRRVLASRGKGPGRNPRPA